ncbi:MAG: GDSL-type esterase/lipase family protein [Saezia sp.]
MHRRDFLNLTLMGLALGSQAGLLSACGNKKLPPIPAGSTVLALGDSLTEGYGATPQTSYPTMLAGLTGWNMVNGGISGNTSEDALQRLPALLSQHRPKLVLTSIGGNDILRKVPEVQMRSNIITICQHIKNSGAQNMLIAVPKFSLIGAAMGALKDHPLYQDIAKELKLPLQSGAWSKILSDERLKSDAIHANAQGYNEFAKLLAQSLREVGYLI